MQTNHETPAWYNSYEEGIPLEIDTPNISLGNILDNTAMYHGKKVALHFENKKIKYKKLCDLAETLAASLRARGIKSGDRVAIMLPNLPQTIIAFWGVIKAGAVAVMTNPLYMETEILHHFKDSGAKHVITVDLLWPRLSPLLDQCGIEVCYITRISDGLAFPLNLLYPLKSKREKSWQKIPFDNKTVVNWKELFKNSDRYSEKIKNPKESLAMLQYTGGTTGVSKGVMLTHYNLVANVYQIHAMLPHHFTARSDHSFVGVMPFFHVYGLTTCIILPVLLNAKVLPLPRFMPLDLLKLIKNRKPNLFPGGPSLYVALLQQKELANYDVHSLELLISGSAPMSVEHQKRFKEISGASICEGFGLTEASPVALVNPFFGKQKIGSIGLPLPSTEARIVDMEVGVIPMPVGKVGELIIRGPQVMSGYWKRPDETAGTLRNGWLYTGDIAYMDEEGYFFIVDRKKDMIITGGYNVYPREIDEVLIEHPKVANAVSVGVSHRSRGESIKAFVVLKEGEVATQAELISFCKQKLANYKVPRQIEFRDDLPLNLVGKVLRRVLKAESESKFDPELNILEENKEQLEWLPGASNIGPDKPKNPKKSKNEKLELPEASAKTVKTESELSSMKNVSSVMYNTSQNEPDYNLEIKATVEKIWTDLANDINNVNTKQDD